MNIVVWLVYRFVKWFVFYLPVHLIFGFDVKGKENLPKGGGYILASNHLGWKDPIVLSVHFRAQISFAAKVELFRYPVFKQVLVLTGQIPLKRVNANSGERRKFYEQAVSGMGRGLVLGIFPEGTRSKSGKLLKFETGAGSIASTTKCIVVPIGLSYSRGNFWPLARPAVHIVIGSSIDSADYRSRELTAELRRRIAELSGQELEDVALEAL